MFSQTGLLQTLTSTKGSCHPSDSKEVSKLKLLKGKFLHINNLQNVEQDGPQKRSQHKQKSLLYRAGPAHIPDWSISMQMKTQNHHSLIDPNSTVLIGKNGVTLIG